MCIGVPMQVVQTTASGAVCATRDGRRREVDTSLIGTAAPGTWLLTHIGIAREIIDAETAEMIANALAAVDLASSGAEVDPAVIDSLFPDLADREPQLPDHLKPRSDKTTDEPKDDREAAA